MDPFAFVVAFGPLGCYFLLLAGLNFARRPVVVSGALEKAGLGLALMGLAIVGPMQLFMPEQAAVRFGPWVWVLLIGFYLLGLTLAVLVGRPRLVVYNATFEQLKPQLTETAKRIDHDSHWAGPVLVLPQRGVQLRVESFPPLASVSLIAIGRDQSTSGWMRLASALAEDLRGVPVAGRAQAAWLVALAGAIFAAVALRIARDPETLAHGLARMLNP